AGIAPPAIAGKEGVPEEERVAFPLEVDFLRQRFDAQAALLEPTAEARRFALSLRVAEVAEDYAVTFDQPGVRGEHHVWEARNRVEPRHLRSNRIRENGVQPVPLLRRRRPVCRPPQIHPGIDFVLDAVIGRRNHQELTSRSGRGTWLIRGN